MVLTKIYWALAYGILGKSLRADILKPTYVIELAIFKKLKLMEILHNQS
jgi:hypothetical protein